MVPCAFWQVDLRVEKGVGVSKKTYLVLGLYRSFFTILKPANVIITAVSGKCGESSETSAPIACTPFPFLGLRLHNGAWSLVCNCRLRSATLDRWLNGSEWRTGPYPDPKWRRFHSARKQYPPTRRHPIRTLVSFRSSFRLSVHTEVKGRSLGNRSNGLAERIKPKTKYDLLMLYTHPSESAYVRMEC